MRPRNDKWLVLMGFTMFTILVIAIAVYTIMVLSGAWPWWLLLFPAFFSWQAFTILKSTRKLMKARREHW